MEKIGKIGALGSLADGQLPRVCRCVKKKKDEKGYFFLAVQHVGQSSFTSDGPMIDYNRKSVGLGLPIATIDSKMQQSIVIGSGTQST